MKKTFRIGLFALSLYALAFGCGGEIPNVGDPAAAKPPRVPILMVHGALGSGQAYNDFREWLVLRGHPKSFVEAPDFKWSACLDEFAREIDQKTQALRKKTGAGRTNQTLVRQQFLDRIFGNNSQRVVAKLVVPFRTKLRAENAETLAVCPTERYTEDGLEGLHRLISVTQGQAATGRINFGVAIDANIPEG